MIPDSSFLDGKEIIHKTVNLVRQVVGEEWSTLSPAKLCVKNGKTFKTVPLHQRGLQGHPFSEGVRAQKVEVLDV